ncbi:unnamed protein product, partial [Brachionus calyciflorus]
MITSRHSTVQIEELFIELKNSFDRLYENDRFLFRLIVIDYSFASIHGLLASLKKENIQSYAKRVFDLANGTISASENKKVSFMRFTHHAQGENREFEESKEFLFKAVDSRPEYLKKIDQNIERYFQNEKIDAELSEVLTNKANNNPKKSFENEKNNVVEDFESVNEDFIYKNDFIHLKKSSPFTEVFISIASEVEKSQMPHVYIDDNLEYSTAMTRGFYENL